jgi:hypothetical protein
MAITFTNPDGSSGFTEWSDLACRIYVSGSQVGDSDFLVMTNMSGSLVNFTVPTGPSGTHWVRLIDTGNWAEGNENFWTVSSGATISGTYGVNNQSIVVLQAVGATPTAATPTFSPGASAVASGTVVTISSATAGSTIYYTTNGTNPTTSSSSGTAGSASATVTVTAAETINAIAVASGYNNSADGSAAYTITSGSNGTFIIKFITGSNTESVTFPGDINSWSLTSNTLSAASNSTYTVTFANLITSSVLAQGNNASTLELQVCNTASGWNGAWGFASWSKTSNIGFSNSADTQLSITCNPGQNVTLTINASNSSLSATVQ